MNDSVLGGAARMRAWTGLIAVAGVCGCTATVAPPQPTVRVTTAPIPGEVVGSTAVPGSANPAVIPQGGPARADSVAARTAAAPASTAPADMTTAPLPKLPGGGAKLADVPQRRVAALDASGSDIRDVTTRLGREFGLQVSFAPEVRGTVSAHLRNVTLDDALRDVVAQNGYQWTIQNGVLRVTAARLETRIFTLDYVALSRVGTGSTVIQRRLGGTVNGNGFNSTGLSNVSGAAGVPGADVISTVSAVDMWQEIRIALAGLMTPPGGAPSNANAGTSTGTTGGVTGANGLAGATGIGASSVTFPDGSSLTISPVSGLINVTASPEKMQEIATFLDAFRASIERQVLIEAKIVEVNLSKSTQYGIDWSAITKLGGLGVTLRNSPAATTTATTATGSTSTSSSPGNVVFNLNGDLQINAVLNALSTQGDVSVLSSPRTSALNNQRATFQVTTDQTFFTVARQPIVGPTGTIGFNTTIQPEQVSVGIVLDVLPQISADNVITMSIRPAVTSVIKTDSITLADGSTAQAPEIARREGDTVARLRAGETMVIGGLMQTSVNRQVSGVPILKDLPVIGALFRHVSNTETRTEMVVFLTPTVISGQPGG
jgi:MSHA type pilus biogenesis protein MshL